MSKHEIIIAADHHEAEAFAAYLVEQGHSATIGNSTGNYVDGVCTDHDAEASETMNRLWNDYCNN